MKKLFKNSKLSQKAGTNGRPSRASAITTKIQTIGSLLRTNASLIVPPFQRNYSWEREHFADLWSDLIEIPMGQGEEYCLGSIVLDNSASPNLTLIDGQQRITTAAILLSTLRLHLLENDQEELAKRIEQDFLAQSDYSLHKRQPSLHLNLNNSEFYNKYIFGARPVKEIKRAMNEEQTSHSNKLLAECFVYMYEQIAAFIKQEGKRYNLVNFANHLIQTLNDYVILIRIDVENDEKAFILFEALNNRGLELSEADLLKNHLFAKAGKKLPSIRANWEVITQNLGHVSIVRFIRHFWLSHYGEIPAQGLYLAFKKKIVNSEEASTLSNGLYEASEHYCALNDPDHYFWEKYNTNTRPSLQDDLKSLNLFRTDQCYILLLAALQNSPDHFPQMLQMIVNFTFRYSTICGLNPSKLQRAYMQGAHFLRANKNIDAQTIFQKFLTPLYPTDSQFQSAFARKSVKNNHLARYILAKINDDLINQSSMRTETNPHTTDLEHILPKKYQENWTTEVNQFPGGPGKYVNRLGNMTLISSTLNKKLGNKDFSTKKQIYARDCLNITDNIVSEENWAANEINQRQNWMATQAVKIWRAQA